MVLIINTNVWRFDLVNMSFFCIMKPVMPMYMLIKCFLIVFPAGGRGGYSYDRRGGGYHSGGGGGGERDRYGGRGAYRDRGHRGGGSSYRGGDGT